MRPWGDAPFREALLGASAQHGVCLRKRCTVNNGGMVVGMHDVGTRARIGVLAERFVYEGLLIHAVAGVERVRDDAADGRSTPRKRGRVG